MGQIHYSFDLKRGISELTELFDLLHKYYPNIPADPQKIGTSMSDANKDRESRNLNEEIKRHQTENSNLKQESKDAKEFLESAKNYEQLSQHLKEKERKIEELVSQHKKLTEEHELELNRIREEKEKEIALLKKQITDWEKKLAVYEPSLGGDTGENKFFNIDREKLSQTMVDTAPFVGKIDPKGNAIFNFNVEKGEHKRFSQNPSELESFCEIIDHIDGANHIDLGEWGKGKFKGGLLIVTEKAKIKLTRD